MTQNAKRLSPPVVAGAGFAVALLGLLWAYWPTLGQIAHKWGHEPVYSHGYLVPLFALALLWLRREQLEPAKLKPSWWGLPLLLAGLALKLIGGHYYFEWFDTISLVPCLFGLCLLTTGWHGLRFAWPALFFLFFMLPLPFSLEVALQGPLQRVGTIASCYVMQTLGLPAFSEGNVIVVNEVRIGVVEACSGLGMLMIFFALSTAVAFLSTDRPVWQRAVFLLSAVPIAIVANVVRITVTGILHAVGFSDAAELLHERLSAFLMMPIALGLLWFEAWFLSRLLIIEDDQPLVVGVQPAIHPSQRRQAAAPVPAGKP